jgi:hypothetical protein
MLPSCANRIFKYKGLKKVKSLKNDIPRVCSTIAGPPGRNSFYGIIFPYGGTYQMLPALSREKAWTKKAWSAGNA